uniref:Uncharacterized protein n=2 Tax=Sus scrofa TaxID=9823 RepID=A0A8D0MIQ5_PIG
MDDFNKGIVWGKKGTVTDEASVKKADVDNCPSVSPYLKGQNKLIFKPDLTLEEVRAGNPKVLLNVPQKQNCSHPRETGIKMYFCYLCILHGHL